MKDNATGCVRVLSGNILLFGLAGLLVMCAAAISGCSSCGQAREVARTSEKEVMSSDALIPPIVEKRGESRRERSAGSSNAAQLLVGPILDDLPIFERFYTVSKRWPTNLNEIVAFADKEGSSLGLSQMKNVKFVPCSTGELRIDFDRVSPNQGSLSWTIFPPGSQKVSRETLQKTLKVLERMR